MPPCCERWSSTLARSRKVAIGAPVAGALVTFVHKQQARAVSTQAQCAALGWIEVGRSRLESAGRSPDRLNGCVGRIWKREDPTRTTFQTVISPRERPYETALAEHEFDVPADVLGMQQPFLEGQIVERKHVGHDPSAGTLVNILEAAEVLFRRLAVLPCELRGDVGSHLAD